MVKVHTVYLSTAITSGINACTKYTAGSSANVQFNVNWDNVFKGYTGEAQLKFKLCGKSSAAYTWANSMGYISINGLSIPYSNNNSIGLVFPNNDSTGTYTSTLAGNVSTFQPQPNYLFGTNLDSTGITVVAPSGYSQLQIQLFSPSDALLTVPDDYII